MDIPVLMMARELGFGGLEAELSKFARQLHKHGIAPHVACFRSGGARWDEIRAAGIPAVTIPVTSFKSPSSLAAGAKVMRQYLRERKILIVHAFDSPTTVFGVPVSRMSGVPAVASQLCFRNLVQARLRYPMLAIDRIVSAFHVNCKAIADHLERDWKVPGRRIHVCYTGVETSEFHPHHRRRPECLAGASVVIGTLAVLREEKNLPMLMDAFARVHRNVDSRARLLIGGDGPMRPVLERQARELQITDACVFPGAVASAADWMSAIDVYVLPSRTEGLSSALIEAMASGCCPVGSRVGGTPEVLKDGERGFLFAPGNLEELTERLSILTRDEGRRMAMARAASGFASEELSIEAAAARLACMYRSLLDLPADPHGCPA